jgi:hypothetical protein
VGTCLDTFCIELNDLRAFDAQNQAALSSSTPKLLTADQLDILVEMVFFRAYRCYEQFIRKVVLLYCSGQQTMSGKSVVSFLSPRDHGHAENLVKSTKPYIEWGNPDEVVQRAELYLDDGFPIKQSYTPRLAALKDLRRIRNHIAHSSPESLVQYRIALRNYFGAAPLPEPAPGRFLLQPDKEDKTKYLLLTILETLQTLAGDVAA